ncbi:response regulator transcription factor [Egbenema bharatensis]|uniref:response regulator transcription factor n=1 Tax=Egbenema bharatensis TaxID=3463334 RepID=UPI003A87C137
MSNPHTETFGDAYQAKSILVLESDERLREAIVQLLQNEQYQVFTAVDGSAGLDLALQSTQSEQEPMDLIVLDQSMPLVDGLTICQRLRQSGSNVPILMISSKTSETDRVVGLELGADDYLPKPFGMRELLARCRALLRRWDSPPDSNRRLAIGDISLDRRLMVAHVRDREVSLSPREFKLLQFFMEHPRQVLSRDLLVQEVWGSDFLKDPKTLDVHIRWLREKLEDDPSHPKYLITMRGFGYRFG